MRSKSDAYAFSALCAKAHFYKNPALVLTESDLIDIVVDGQYDGGVDVLLSDPNSEESDLVIGQSKFSSNNISSDDVMDAVMKMCLFYKDMVSGHYEQVNETVQRRFISLYSEASDEAKIHFVLYTSAPQARIRRDRIERKFREQFPDDSRYILTVLFGADIEEEIKESESRRPTVETGKIKIDDAGNCLWYGDNAVIVNVSAFSIKFLYAQHSTNLLSRNLRYHIKGRDIDQGIANTIKESPESFWFKNNGITIICDNFEVDGREVKLSNFSIVNGGQTTYMLHKSPLVNESRDLYLPCKIIMTEGDNEEEKQKFSLEIAKAANSQKAIKPVDLKANAPEQVRFSQAMREVGIFYQTKRGEIVPTNFKLNYLNTDLVQVGKLALAAIFQLPCASRSKPSSLYLPQYYEVVFGKDQMQVAKLCRELLYIDYYFRTNYQKKFDRENNSEPDAADRISFAHNARTICIAFVAFASRYRQGNITKDDLTTLFRAAQTESASTSSELYSIFSDLGNVDHLLPQSLFASKDEYDTVLNKLFNVILESGITFFSTAKALAPEEPLTATNFLKRDKNYYQIIKTNWNGISREINSIFDDLGM